MGRGVVGVLQWRKDGVIPSILLVGVGTLFSTVVAVLRAERDGFGDAIEPVVPSLSAKIIPNDSLEFMSRIDRFPRLTVSPKSRTPDRQTNS